MIKRTNVSEDGVESEAVFSHCENYRYSLMRTWDSLKKRVVFIGLNPSTATELKNDPTVARIMVFARDWGYGSATVLNLFAFRATLPSDMKKVDNPVGKENDYFIKRGIKGADKIVVCWGNHGLFLGRGLEVREMIGAAECFGLTKVGEPKHPLYLRRDAELLSC